MTNSHDALGLTRQKNELIKMLGSVRAWIRILSTCLVLLFGWLKLGSLNNSSNKRHLRYFSIDGLYDHLLLFLGVRLFA
jgi:hypothetical protein